MNKKLQSYVDSLPVISVHEHHRQDAAPRSLEDLLRNSYVAWQCDPIPDRIADRTGFLERLRLTSSFRWFEQGLRAVYDIRGPLMAKTWDAWSERVRSAHAADPNWHVSLMRRAGRYERAIQDSFWKPGDDAGHPEFFSPALRINPFVLCHHPDMRDHNGNSPWSLLPSRPRTFGAYLEQIEALVERGLAQGMAALKSALAYDRDLDFQPARRSEAARVFGRRPSEVKPGDTRAYQDFMFTFFCEFAGRHELPFQVHTGLAQLAGSNPLRLEPMIARHPRVRFMLLHGGYPWTSEVAALSFGYRNVYPDLTWLPIISTTATVRALREWLEVAPNAERICWGGDCWTGEESVGAAVALKRALTLALSAMMREGACRESDARRLARAICHDNAARLYPLSWDRRGT